MIKDDSTNFLVHSVFHIAVFKVVVKHYFVSNNLKFSHIVINSSVSF